MKRAWIGILALSDCFVFIEPGEQGLRERFGRPSGEVLGSGVAVKFPRPIDVVHRGRRPSIPSGLTMPRA